MRVHKYEIKTDYRAIHDGDRPSAPHSFLGGPPMSINFGCITKPRQPRKGEVWFVKELEFQGGDGSKSRPVVIISCG